jgi:Tfp pilus assembly protein PilE
MTLIEVLVTLIIIGILVGITAMGFFIFQQNFTTDVSQGYQSQVISAEINYAQANGSFTSSPTQLGTYSHVFTIVNGPVTSTSQVSIAVDATTGQLGVASMNQAGTCFAQRVDLPINGGTRTTVSLSANAACDGASTITNPVVLAGAPTITSVTPASGSIAVTWTPSATQLGNAVVTGFTAVATPGGASCSASASSTACTITGLTNGTGYSVVVTPTTTAGPGTPSAPSATVTPAGVPGVPLDVSATDAQNAQSTITWTAPPSNGATITAYTLTDSAADTWTTSATTACGSTSSCSYVATGLTNGSPYTFTVTATNAQGTSSISSPSNTITPVTTPGAPTGLTAVAAAYAATLSWTAPASTGGSDIQWYAISDTAGDAWTTDPTSACGSTSSCSYTTPSTLTAGTAYTFSVAAANAAGTGASSGTASATPFAAPSAPTALTATTGVASVSLTWTTPVSNGGSAITGYAIKYSTDATTWVTATANTNSTSTSYTVTGLSNATTYDFEVAAVNVYTTGTYSPYVQQPTASAPSAPSITSASPVGSGSSNQITATWNAPASNGGAAIISYTATAGGQTCTTTSTTCTISNITLDTTDGGSAVGVTVAATNAVGSTSSTSVSVTMPRLVLYGARGECLSGAFPNSWLTSADGLHHLVVNGTSYPGRLILWHQGTVIWSNPTGTGGTRLCMQGDGNVVMYNSSGTAVWSNAKAGSGTSNVLIMQNDGNLVEYSCASPVSSGTSLSAWCPSGNETVVWATNTSGK